LKILLAFSCTDAQLVAGVDLEAQVIDKNNVIEEHSCTANLSLPPIIALVSLPLAVIAQA
jgi:hypothetical protein